MKIFTNSIAALSCFFLIACEKSDVAKRSDVVKKVGSFEVIFKKPTGDGIIAQFNDEKLERETIIRGTANYQNLMSQQKDFEVAMAYKQIMSDFSNQSIAIDFFRDKPQRDLKILLKMLNTEASKDIKTNFQGQSEEPNLVAQVEDKKYYLKDLNLNHTSYLQMKKQMRNEVLRKLWESITYMALKNEAAKQGIKTKELLEKNQLMKAQEASDEEVRDFLASINAKLSEINEKQFERFRAVVTQKNQDEKIRAFINKNIIKKPIVVYIDQLDQSIEVAVTDTIFKGPENGSIKINLFTDLICSNCREMWTTVQKVQEKYGDQVRLGVFHQYQKNDLFAIFVAEASRCVNDQGERLFWGFIDAIQSANEDVTEKFMNDKVEKVGANLEAYKKCIMERKHKDLVQKQNDYASSLGFYRVPNLVINGEVFMGKASMEDLEPLLKQHYRKKNSLGFLASLWKKIGSIF